MAFIDSSLCFYGWIVNSILLLLLINFTSEYDLKYMQLDSFFNKNFCSYTFWKQSKYLNVNIKSSFMEMLLSIPICKNSSSSFFTDNAFSSRYSFPFLLIESLTWCAVLLPQLTTEISLLSWLPSIPGILSYGIQYVPVELTKKPCVLR